MKIAVVAAALPHPQGTAAGRDLWAWGEATRALGHDLQAWVWHRPRIGPTEPIPDWVVFDPVVVPPSLGAHLRAVVSPRSEPARRGWRAPPGAVAVADQAASASAVLGQPRSVVTVHYRALADARAVGRVRLADVQDARAERRAGRQAELVLAYSERVGRRLGRPARVVPLTCPMPDSPLPDVEAPVAALMADWGWPPNRMALDRLLELWPKVAGEVAGARLLLAGRNFPTGDVGTVKGVEVVGPVADSTEVLSRAAVVAFPCPDSSGPKAKTLEALAHGRPVLTTAAGVEGLVLPAGATEMVSDMAGFATALAVLLRDPSQRARLGALGRQAMLDHHSPHAAAEARLRAFSEAFGA